MAHDLILRGGHVVDPLNGLDGIRAIAVEGAASPPSAPPPPACASPAR